MTGHTWAARAVTVDTERRVIEAVVIPYGETARVTDDARTFYTESFDAGGATPAERVAVYGGHRVTPAGVERGPLIGRAGEWSDTPEGLRAELTIANTIAGSEVLELADVLGVVHVSAEYKTPRRYRAGETVVRSAKGEGVTIDGLAVILPPQRPAFSGAAGAARTDTEEQTMSDTDTDEEEGQEEEEPTESVRALVSTAVRAEVARMNVGGARVRSAPPHPLARFATFQDAAVAAREAPPVEGLGLSSALRSAWAAWHVMHRYERATGRALVDQITTDNPGVMPPAWLTEVFGIIDAGRPAIQATGGPRSAGTTGTDISWPYFDGDLTALVGEQLLEKTEITSVKVSLKKGTADLDTFAGGSDISLQLERRSDPSYVATYNSIMSTAYGLTTEFRYENDLLALAVPATFLPLTADAAAWRAFLFSASTKVKRATGAPASAVLVSTDVWEYVGGLEGLYNSQYGTANVAGTSSASELTVNVNGLTITEAPGFPGGQAVVTNGRAASWVEDGPQFITQIDVNRLGHNIAIWGMGATAAFLPAGIIKADDGVALAASSGRSKS